jgi:hypothetical protein
VLHGNIHRHLLVLSLANWAIAIVCWTISAYLGIARPTNLIVYTVLFVVGLFAVIVAVGSFVLADFGTEPGRPAVAAATADAGAAEVAAPADKAAGPGA